MTYFRSSTRRRWWMLLLLVAICLLVVPSTCQENATTSSATNTSTNEINDDDILIWASTGGGWRAMFADIGYANLFQQAGLLTQDSSRFHGVSTTSGASWFSTQFFYSPEFYNRTALAETPEELEEFSYQWLDTYLNISSDIDNQTMSDCNVTDLRSENDSEEVKEATTTLQDICYLVNKYDYDWALFIQEMLRAASIDYGDPDFVNRLAQSDNRVAPLQSTDLLIQAAVVPSSRIRNAEDANADSTAVYLGHGNNQASGTAVSTLFAVVLSAAWVVDSTGAFFRYGSEDRTDVLQTYVAPSPASHSWDEWEDFYLYDGEGTQGTTGVVNQQSAKATLKGELREPFGGADATTVVQVAAISSAAAGQGSPLAPTTYTHFMSLGFYTIDEAKVKAIWRVLAGLAAGIGTTLVFGFLTLKYGEKWCCKIGDKCCASPESVRKWAIGVGITLGALVGLLTGFLYGVGSIFVPTIYDVAVDRIYQNPKFDKFAVCSQWPQTCGEDDGILIDGWFVDNPAFVINVGQQQLAKGTDKRMKAIITNTNQEWNTTFNRVQILLYFKSYFNEGVDPGNFLWAPSYWAPFRSPQIFEEYIDEDGLDALLEPIEGSNMTTARLSGTTVNNPSFGVMAGQTVEILLLNLNEPITTYVVGKSTVEKLTPNLANMTRDIAANQVLLERVIDFVDS